MVINWQNNSSEYGAVLQEDNNEEKRKSIKNAMFFCVGGSVEVLSGAEPVGDNLGMNVKIIERNREHGIRLPG